MNTVTRYAGVAIAICSWIAVSNHCAFAAVATSGTGCKPESHHRQDADATRCPFHSKPAKQKEQSSQVQCCKILRAVVIAQSKAWARDDTNFSDALPRIENSADRGFSFRTLAPLSLDTGPPGTRSFAELILQRSLLAHAPPVLE
jgi:hypothetical protein